ncbi:MAG TPA: DUF1707 domain-containing protein, partial [Acidimicrobiales bacterium]
MPDRRDMRIGDAERDQAITVLRTHTAEGRLTLDEFADLAGEVYAARTFGDLEDVGRNLPGGLALDRPAPAQPPAGPGAGTRSGIATRGPGRRRRWFVAVMSGARVRGRWRAARRIQAVAFWGVVHVDLREAEIEGPVVDVTAWAIMGGVTVTVPPGVPVEVDGLVLMGGTTDQSRPGEALPGAPLVRVHARGLWGGVGVRTKRTRAQRAAAAAAGGEVPAGEPGERAAGRLRPDGGDDRPDDLLALPRRILDDLATTLPHHDGPPVEIVRPGQHPVGVPVPPDSPWSTAPHPPPP